MKSGPPDSARGRHSSALVECSDRVKRPRHVCALAIFRPLRATLDECRGLRHHGKLAEAQTCYAKLAESSNPYLRAEGLWGIERIEEANDQFRDLIKQNPKNADYRVRWGHLFFERFKMRKLTLCLQRP